MRPHSLFTFVILALPANGHAQQAWSPHAEELAQHRWDPPVERHAPITLNPLRPPAPPLARVVYGYLPYWSGDLDTLRWSALTHLAWFAVEMDAAGNPTLRHGWPDTATVQAAHAGGVRVDLTFTLFDGGDILALCSTPSRRTTAITTMIDLLEEGDADGISVDFEGLNSGTRDHFTTFITELRATLTSRGHPDAQISIAGPSSWGLSEFDLPALLNQADYYFIMAYGFFWGGSTHAGPPGLLRVTEDWTVATTNASLKSIGTISSLIPANLRRQIIYGIPYYGREYVTTNDSLGASVTSQIGSVTYTAAKADLAAGKTRRWHPGSSTSWYAWQEAGSWHQTYYEDAASLAAKYQLAWDQDLAGIGIWALNYDRPYSELWDLLETSFSSEPPPVPGDRFLPLPVAAFPFHDERDTTNGPSRYFNFYSCADTLPEFGREWVYRLDVCQPGTLTAHVPDYPDRDPDLHLLSAADQDACLSRAHTDLSTPISAGEYLLTVDTYVAGGVEQEGPYTLDVDFQPVDGSVPCSASQTCHHGACQCLDAQLTACSDSCVNVADNSSHCGRCNHACNPGSPCVDGGCSTGTNPDAGNGSDAGYIADSGLDTPDASPADSGRADAGRADSGRADSGTRDGGSPIDAGSATPDASKPAIPEIGGRRDSLAEEDGPGGCNCQGSSPWTLGWVLLLGLWRPRKRQ